MRERRRWVPWLFAGPALLVFTAAVVLPVIWSLSYSLFDWSGLGKMEFIGIENYVRMFSDNVFRAAVVNNLIFTVISTLVQVVLGLLLAILLLSLRKVRDFVKVVYFIPCVISSVAISQIFRQMLSADPEGIVNAVFGGLGLEQLQGAYLSNPQLTLLLVSLIDAYKFCAIYMVIYLTAFLTIDQDVLDAAAIDGANWWQQYVSIKFPMIKGIILVTIVLLISGTLKAFDVSYILTGGGPGSSSELVSTYLYKVMFNSSHFGYGSAIAVFLVVECLVIVAVLRRVFRSESEAA